MSFVWASPCCEKRDASEKLKMKIIVVSDIRTRNPPLDHSATALLGDDLCLSFL